MRKHPESVIHAVTTAYATALTVDDPIWRARNQYVLASLRDLIAEMTGRSSEEIQELFEAAK